MTLDELDAFCVELPGCMVRYPFDTAPNLRAWCVRKKMFAWAITSPGSHTVQLKAHPDLVTTLARNYEYISPGYHMNKKHWITVDFLACDDELLRGLLEDAHGLIVANLPGDNRSPRPGNDGRA